MSIIISPCHKYEVFNCSVFIDQVIFRSNFLGMRLPWECHDQSQQSNWCHRTETAFLSQKKKYTKNRPVCNIPVTVNPHPTRGNMGHYPKSKTKQGQCPTYRGHILSLIPTKMRIISHIKETKKHLVKIRSITLLYLQLFEQEMHSHSPSRTFYISTPAHEEWYQFTLQCKLSHPIMLSSRFGSQQGQRMSSSESSSDSLKSFGKQSSLLPW